MNSLPVPFLKKDKPVSVRRKTNSKSPTGPFLQPIQTPGTLNASLTRQPSSTSCTRIDVQNLKKWLNQKLEEKQARDTGICPVRRELYTQIFDELIRQVRLNCADRGNLLQEVRDEMHKTIAAYQTLYESSTAFAIRKSLQTEKQNSDMQQQILQLEKEKKDFEEQLNKQKAEYEAIVRGEKEQRGVERKKYEVKVRSLERTISQLKANLDYITDLKVNVENVE